MYYIKIRIQRNQKSWDLYGIRPYKEIRTQIWVDRIANIYFHLNFDCVKKVASNLKVEDVRIALDDYAALSDAHLMVLAQCGLLEGLIKIVEAELQVISDNVFKYLYTFLTKSVCRITQ